MRPLKAFVAKSFASMDEGKTQKVERLLDRFRPLGLTWETAERAEIESVSQKVRQRIDECDIFVGVFTRRHPIFSEDLEQEPDQRPGSEPVAWTGPPWLFQESGYALKAKKKLMLFREAGVELPLLQGDLEYIPYDPEAPDAAWEKALEILVQLTAQNAGIEVGTIASVPEPPQTASGEAEGAKAVAASAGPEPSSFMRCIDELLDAQIAGDAAGIDRAEKAGLEVIKAGSANFDEVEWRSWCLGSRARIGRSGALERLQQLAAEHPTHSAPYKAMATVAIAFGEHKIAGDWYVKAAEIQPTNLTDRIQAAKEFREAKLVDCALEQLKLVLDS